MKIETARFVRSAHSKSDLLRDGFPQFAFVGRSNVGKSSLLNGLLGRRALARTSKTPGRTRAVNYFLINRRLYFVDLPGYGYAKAGKQDRRDWARLVESYLQNALPLAHLIQLVDSKVGATDLDLQGLEYFNELGARPTVVATKIDRVPRSKRSRGLKEIRERMELTEDTQLIPFSSKTGEGVKDLWKVIEARLATSPNPAG